MTENTKKKLKDTAIIITCGAVGFIAGAVVTFGYFGVECSKRGIVDLVNACEGMTPEDMKTTAMCLSKGDRGTFRCIYPINDKTLTVGDVIKTARSICDDDNKWDYFNPFSEDDLIISAVYGIQRKSKT